MQLTRAFGAAISAIGIGAALAAATSACTVGETLYETETYPARAKASAVKTCAGAFAKPDLATLKPCADGNGHCFDKTKVPATGDLEACDDNTVCVPNALLKAGGKKLKSCSSLNDKPGACLDPAAPLMVQFKDAIPKGGCEGEMLCVPCVDVRNGEDTHMCDDEVGVYEAACSGGDGAGRAATQSCCHGAGVCMLADAVDADQREDMTRQTCPSKKLCAPADQASGKPMKCDLLGADGVCVDLCFADMLRGAGKAMRSSCRATEICMPCALGKSRGMRGCE
jgi:hypothetical protein